MSKNLSLQNQVFQNIIDALPLLLFWTNTENIYVGSNFPHAEAFGFLSSDELIGKPLTYLFKDLHLEDALIDRVVDEHNEIMRSKIGKKLEYTAIMADGRERTWLSYKEPLLDENDEVVGLIGISADITELTAAKKQAEAASHAKSDFIANMSHDIRTPITGMLGLTQNLIDVAEEIRLKLSSATLSKPSRKELQDVLCEISDVTEQNGKLLMSATDELLQLCNEILDVVRLESGKLEEKPESFDLYKLVQHNIELFQPAAYHQHLSLSVDVAKNTPQYLFGLSIYFDRILLNLISNALKFTKKGGVKIAVKLVDGPDHAASTIAPSVGDLVTLELSVEDTGIGIPKEKHDVIFEYFSRLASSYEGTYKGSGLGLYTVKRHLKLMKGTVKIKSELGKGTCFTLTIPFRVADHADRIKSTALAQEHQSLTPVSEKFSSQSAILKSTSSPGEQTTIAQALVIEDNPAASMMIRKLLEKQQCAVVVASTGRAGFKKVQEQQYDLIFMDVGLPDVSGLEIARKIRRLPDKDRAEVPIIALTGHLSDDSRLECKSAGINTVLAKPTNGLMLQSILARFVFGQEVSFVEKAKPDVVQEEAALVVDWPGCVRLLNGDEVFAKKMLILLAKELKSTKKSLKEAYQAKDIAGLKRELHRCLGGLCYLCVPRLKQATEDFQKSVEKEPQNSKHIATVYQKMREEMEAFSLYVKNQKE